MKKNVTFSISVEIVEKLKAVSEETGISQSRIIEDGLNRRIEEIEKMVEINWRE